MRKLFKNGILGMALAGVLATGGLGCASGAGNGALIGGASGAGLGAIIGNNSHRRTTEGALIGGAVGALAGGLIGDSHDREQRARDRYYDDDRYYGSRYDDGHRGRGYAYRRYDDCPPDYYEYRSYRSYGRGGYSEYRSYRY